jgi:hypothetical protein
VSTWRPGYPPMPKPKNALGMVQREDGTWAPTTLHVPHLTPEEWEREKAKMLAELDRMILGK